MDWNKHIVKILLSGFVLLLVVACSVSYSFTGAGALDYTKYKTISITDFPIRSTYVYAPLGTTFNQELRDKFSRQTKLTSVSANGDFDIEGEITGYNQYNEAVDASGYSSKTKLTINITARITDGVKDVTDEKKYTAFRTYDSSQLLTAVQDELIAEMVTEIVDQIYMDTVANW